MYVGPGVLDIVAFIGFRDPGSETGIRCEGTGFFVLYKTCGYLVTVRHVAKTIGSDPFVVRVNRKGRAELIDNDMADWSYHPDPTVDVAVVPLALPQSDGFDVKYSTEDQFLLKKWPEMRSEGIGVGSPAYVVGLFHYIYGHQCNMPVVHSGNISLLPPDGERIPVWDEATKSTEKVEAYLVQSVAINGASGSPVFARRTLTSEPWPWPSERENEIAQLPGVKLKLLGVFSGAWFAPPDAAVATAIRARPSDKVPVGIGVVVPANKIIEAMETPAMQKYRTKHRPLKLVTAARSRKKD